jgi:hypothetical protein
VHCRDTTLRRSGGLGRRSPQHVETLRPPAQHPAPRARHGVVVPCQLALKIDPQSASEIDPPFWWFQLVPVVRRGDPRTTQCPEEADTAMRRVPVDPPVQAAGVGSGEGGQARFLNRKGVNFDADPPLGGRYSAPKHTQELEYNAVCVRPCGLSEASASVVAESTGWLNLDLKSAEPWWPSRRTSTALRAARLQDQGGYGGR